MNYSEVETRAQKAMKLIAAINPQAEKVYTVDEFGKKLCNGLYLGDCQGRCSQIGKKLSVARLAKEARISHEIPLFVFAVLNEEETIEFIRKWED